ncbi:hypothetical protein [Pseudoalteromonas fuliginea]|uniref:hypothetical protein n=1 Tax=Pseudoalteromonas fuliginea TaxID=1872678 RepID=UPI00316BBBC6
MSDFLPLAGVCVGALLAGLFTLISNRHNFDREFQKENLRLKQAHLEEGIKYGIEYFSAGGLLISAIDGVSKDIEANGHAYSDAKVFLTNHDGKFTDSQESLEYCTTLKVLWDYHNYLSVIRTEVFRSGEHNIPLQSDMKNYLEYLGHKRTEFFSVLLYN